MYQCKQECEQLLTLINALPSNSPEQEAALKNLRSRMLDLMSDPEIETLPGEQTLDEVTNQLRQLWMWIAHQFSDPHFKSPPQPNVTRLPSGQTINYSYERNIEPDILEKRVAAYRPVPPGWHADHVLFSSGMAGLATFLQSYLSMVRPTSQAPLKLVMWGGYFETHALLELLSHDAFSCCRTKTQASLWNTIVQGDADVLLLEPVSYDWDMEVLDLQKLVSLGWQRQTKKAKVIVIDTTLVGESIPRQQLFTDLAGSPPTLFVQLSSGLKLDQQGLEFSNVGIVSIYTFEQENRNPKASQFAQYLRSIRQIVGSGLSMDEIALLDVPFFLDRKSMSEYAKAVFLNNAQLAQSIKIEGGIFSRISHPSLSWKADLPWAHAPFVILHLAEDTLVNHSLLLSVVDYEARRRGLSLTPGGSFGFRNHRFEVILPRLSDKGGLFKVAMGARNGPSRNGVIELLNELAGYSDFAALHAGYHNVTPVDLQKVWN